MRSLRLTAGSHSFRRQRRSNCSFLCSKPHTETCWREEQKAFQPPGLGVHVPHENPVSNGRPESVAWHPRQDVIRICIITCEPTLSPVPPTLKTRKPVVKLTSGDLRAFPIWEFAIDEVGTGEQDETWVRPVDRPAIPKGAYSQIVAAEFSTAAGRRLEGFMIVTTANGQVEVDPGAVVGSIGYRVIPRLSRRLAVRRRAPWVVEDRERLLSALDQSEYDVFPLRYLLRVPVRGEREPREGVLR